MKQPKFRFRDTARMLQDWGRNMPRLSGYDEAGGKDDFATWQRKGRKKLRELIGLLPMKTPKPQSWLLEVEKLDAFDREHWAIESPFGDHMFFYRLVPAQQPRAVMFALHGHGTYGADPVVGIMKGRYGEEVSFTNANYNYGEEFAKRGYLVYALTQRGFSVRCDLDNPANGPDVPHDTLYPPPGCSCQDINTRAILLGTTDIGLRIQDAMHLIDWIKTRKDEKSLPLGCVGLSGGGHTTEFLTALDTRIQAASIQGYFSYWVDQIMDVTHCACNYVPFLLRHFEQDDVCGLIAPRPLLVTTADEDGVAPIKSFRKAYKSLQGMYGDQGAEGNLEADTFKGGHEFSGRKAFEFFEKHLG